MRARGSAHTAQARLFVSRTGAPVCVRPAEPGDDGAVAALLAASWPGRFAFYAGSQERVSGLLRAALDRGGNDASREIVLVAEVGGAVAGAIAVFPLRERRLRRARFARLALGRRPPWRWPRIVRVARGGVRAARDLPIDSLYVDSLTTDEAFRRIGVASALLDAASERARRLELSAVSLYTHELNQPARALYAGSGFLVAQQTPRPSGEPLVPYVRELPSSNEPPRKL
jgi:ribosomal protein S18 acetylase RimI-like enzyme